jgi:hypothetical protein
LLGGLKRVFGWYGVIAFALAYGSRLELTWLWTNNESGVNVLSKGPIASMGHSSRRFSKAKNPKSRAFEVMDLVAYEELLVMN